MATTVNATNSSAANATTTSVATTQSNSDIATANRAAAQQLINSLSAGSGVDVASLAQNLVNAEKVPRQNELNAKISKNDARVSGYSAISFMFSELNKAFTALKDKSSFNTLSVNNSNSDAIGVTADVAASVSSHAVDVVQLARAQRSVSDGFQSTSSTLNGGKAMVLSFAINPDTFNPKVDTTQGTDSVTESATVAFKDLAVGQSVNINGLTLTATSAMTAAQVAAAYSNVSAGNTPSNPSGGTFSGSLSSFSTGSNTDGNLVFTSTTPNLNVNDLSISVASKKITIPAGSDNPAEVVSDINAAGMGITAQIVNTGDGSKIPYKIVLTGSTGSANSFNVNVDYQGGSGSPGLVFGDNVANQTAADANLMVDGITFTRSSNTINDAVTGLTFSLKAKTTSTASISLARDTSPIKDKMNALVTAYKDANDILTEVSNPNSTLDTYGKTLVGDSTVQSLRQQLRGLFTNSSSTPGAKVSALWQMGFSIDEKGAMTLDAKKLDTCLNANFDDVVMSFTGGYSNLSATTTLSAGFAGDAVKRLTSITGSTGILKTNSDSATKQNADYKTKLQDLDTRMAALLDRYTKQFAAMNKLVGMLNSQKTSLKSTFDGMMSMYTNK